MTIISVFLVLWGIGSAEAGIFGSGNTADSSLQLNFTRSTAALLLKEVTPQDVEYASSRKDLAELYRQCRDVMYLGLLTTRVELVESIPDGGRYHAVARRVDRSLIQFSRSEIHRLMKAGLLTNPFLTALFLHEVGHDCAPGGRRLDDASDGLLNELALAVIEASGARTFSNFIDIDFIGRVAEGRRVVFAELSQKVQKELVERWADYVGDMLYLKERASFPDRPAPASRFHASEKVSVFLGWGELLKGRQVPASLASSVDGLLGESVKQGIFTLGAGRPLPLDLRCRSASGGAARAASCTLLVDARGAPAVGAMQEIEFRLDLFGKLELESIRFR